MTRALVLGDTHGDVTHFVLACRAASDHGCDRIIQVGDFGYLWPSRPEPWDWLDETLGGFGLECWFLDGNHDWLDRLPLDAPEPLAMSRRVTYLPRGCHFQLGDLACVALGGGVSIDKGSRMQGVSWWPQETTTRAQFERACAVGKVDVMFSHDAPEIAPTLDRFLNSGNWNLSAKLERESQASRVAVRGVMDACQPKTLFHGHLHTAYTDRIDGTEVIGLGCNYDGPDSWRVLDCDHAKVEV